MTNTSAQPAEIFAELQPLLFAIAYRMLGSVASAEDVMQEAFVRFDRAARAIEAGQSPPIASPRAYLSAIVTRLAIDELRSARARRETYIGEWLPEPVLTDDGPGSVATSAVLSGDRAADPQAHVEAAETLSMAFLLVLDRLNPVERAVFLLHDVFGYEFAEIAPMVGRSEVNCRQIAARARRRVRSEKPRLDSDRRRREEVARTFLDAMRGGDIETLRELLAADAVVYGDGGGKVPQWAAPISGHERVARLLAGVGQLMVEHRLTVEPREINGQPGAIVRAPDGSITNVYELQVRDGRVDAFRSVVNPEKLRHLGPVADVRQLAAERRRSP